MSPIIIIAISVIAGAILSVLVDYLIKQWLPEKPEAKHRMATYVAVFILVFIIAWSLTSQSNDPPVSPPTMIAVSQAPNASPTQTIATNSPIPMELPSPSPTLTLGEAHPFKVGDFFIYDVRQHVPPYPEENWEERYEVTGVELVEGYQTWVIAKTLENMSPSMQENYTADYSTLWIDQNSGVLIKSEHHIIYAKERTFGLEDGQAVQKIIRRTVNTIYNLDQNIADQNISMIDTSGQEHNSHRSFSVDSIFVFRITRNVQLGELYSWNTIKPAPTVTREETVSLPLSTFDCWVIKWGNSADFYTLSFFDKNTGMLVKIEDWHNNSGTWEKVAEQSLVSYKFDQ